MQLVATVMSALVAGIGAIAVFWPDILLEWARYFTTPNGLLVAAAIRITYGGLLLTVAATSRAPNLLRVFGALILIAGLATPVVGPAYARHVLEIAATDRGSYVRIAGTVAIALGCVFAWALSPKSGQRPR